MVTPTPSEHLDLNDAPEEFFPGASLNPNPYLSVMWPERNLRVGYLSDSIGEGSLEQVLETNGKHTETIGDSMGQLYRAVKQNGQRFIAIELTTDLIAYGLVALIGGYLFNRKYKPWDFSANRESDRKSKR